MPKNLVIVESPAKARTIARFLGNDYEIKSSYGHIRDLPKKDFGVDIEHGFEPAYEISADKKDVANELKKAAKNQTVWLASDEDREGEAIAWHICHILGLDPKKTNRIVFHEITKSAITNALEHPRTIDGHLVDAQQARRILDRLVGYELSPILWKKVRTGLSAGRVQSVAVRLIVEREREIRQFEPESSYKITGLFETDGKELPAELSTKLTTTQKSKEFLNDAAKASYKVLVIEQKPGSRSPSAPFTTSTLQQEAARKLGFGVRQTMMLAQRLYEHGHISYMRTDSVNLSEEAISAAQKFITKNYGDKYSEVRRYRTKSASAQEAHEAIRPTHIEASEAGADAAQKKLYDLIWRRTVASQMAPAKIQKTEVTIGMSNRDEKLLATGEVLSFDGFIKVYGGGKDDRILPEVKEGQALELKSMNALETLSRPPARYSEASLVRKLEELSIGRPSTYAPTISTIQDRDYVEKKDLEGEERELTELVLKDGQVTNQKQIVRVGADRGKLVPTHLAEVVTDFLIKYFASVVDYNFTAEAEKKLDDIADGKLTWKKMLEEFYKHFHPLVEKSKGASREEASQMRKLGRDPKSGKDVFVRYGRYGPVLQLGETGDKEDKEAPKPQFAPLPQGATLDDVTLEQALPMFNLPREVGTTQKGETITADVGRFGPYIKVGNSFTSIKDLDPSTITEKEAREILTSKEKAEKERIINDFDGIQVLNGPYGPYISNGKKNARIPKDKEPKAITKEEAEQILAAAPDKKGRRYRGRATRSKKA